MVVRLENNRVVEIIPEYAIPVKAWYGETFAKSCMETNSPVQIGWVYDPITETFSPYVEPDPGVTLENLKEQNKLLKAQLQAQSDRADFIEDCIAEMATQVYGGV